MEPIVIYKKKISWFQWRDIGLPVLQLRTKMGDYWIQFCRKYSECIAHFYDDFALVQLVERSGQVQVPAVVPYNRIYVERKGDKRRIRFHHPSEHIVLPIRPSDLTAGDYETLLDILASGLDAENDRTRNCGVEAEPYYCE